MLGYYFWPLITYSLVLFSFRELLKLEIDHSCRGETNPLEES